MYPSNINQAVKDKVQGADPVLAEWIQKHLYGDVYSSPGLTMRQKQLCTVAGLVHADMMEQLFGHSIAVR